MIASLFGKSSEISAAFKMLTIGKIGMGFRANKKLLGFGPRNFPQRFGELGVKRFKPINNRAMFRQGLGPANYIRRSNRIAQGDKR